MTTPRAMPPYKQLRRALARQAYTSDTVRLVNSDVSGADCLVTTRNGLFAVNQSSATLVAHGLFFGMDRLGDHLFLFEACDGVHDRTKMGRIVQLRLGSGHLSHPEILCKGLENGCHQIATVGDSLYVLDTYQQRVQSFTLDGAFVAAFDPVPQYSSEGFYAPMMAHMNSISEVGDNIHIMLHNGGIAPPEPSEVLVFDRQWQLLDRYEIDGFGCHDIVRLEDETLLYCGSEDGELISSNGLKVRVSDHMTRGLDYTNSLVMIGTSRLVAREERDMVDGSVIFLDRSYQRLSEVPLHGAPTCIMAL